MSITKDVLPLPAIPLMKICGISAKFSVCTFPSDSDFPMVRMMSDEASLLRAYWIGSNVFVVFIAG